MQPINDVVFASFPKSHYNNVENEYSAKLIINNISGIVGYQFLYALRKKVQNNLKCILSILQEKRNWKRFQKVINCVQRSCTALMASLIIIAISSVVEGHLSCLYTFSF